MKFRVTFLLAAMPLFLLTQETWSQAQPQWRTLPNAPRTTSRFDDVFFINPQVGWVIGSRGEIFKTSDGGVSWKQPSTITSSGLRCVGFANAAKGWVGTLHPDNFFFMTTDSGKTWNRVDNIPEPKPLGICGISVVNENIVYASGLFDDAPRVIKTTDGGQTWQTIDLSAHARALVDCYFFSADSGFVVGAMGTTFQDQRTRVLFTADGGKKWSVRFTGTRPSELCWKISFPKRNTGYVSIEAFNQGATYFLKTTDGGVTWKEKVLSNTLRDVQGIGFMNEKWGWEGAWARRLTKRQMVVKSGGKPVLVLT